MSARYVLLLTLLIAGAAGSWYAARQSAETSEGQALDLADHRGYYLEAARILGTGSDGALLYEINAARAEQRSDNRIEFSEVRIEYSPASDVPWTIRADMATLYPDRKRVLLQGHVVALSERGFSGDETEIRAPALELDPENYVAETDERVQVRIGARSLTGTGMRASLNENRMELKSNVSGRFIP